MLNQSISSGRNRRKPGSYLYGNDLRVHAVWGSGEQTASVFLPAGQNWLDLWSGKHYPGGQTLEVAINAYEIPIFQGGGSRLSLPDLQTLWAERLNLARVKPSLQALEKKEKCA